MTLPNGENADVPDLKLTSYLLSDTHPVGWPKAQLLRSSGYNEFDADALKEGLLTIARNAPVTDVISTRYGAKYVVDGYLLSPSGEALKMRTGWIIQTGYDRPRLVTAYSI